MLDSNRVRVAVASVLALAFSASSSVLAIGPQDQVLIPTFDPVVRILHDSQAHDPGDGYFAGTGTIVDNHNKDGEGWFCVLTADHVISTTGTRAGAVVSKPGIAFDNSTKDSGDSPYIRAAARVFRHGANKTTDLAVLRVNYGAYDANYDSLVRNLVPASGFFFFTDIGYGNEGRLRDISTPADGIADGYQSQGKYGIQRFMNDKISTFNTSGFSPFGGYVYDDAAIWYIDNPITGPEDWDGSGTTYDADSGSPYFSSGLELDELSNLLLYTNDQFAVHTGTDTANNPAGAPAGFKAFGVQNYGVALTQADIDWIHGVCAVPEPSTFVLFVLGWIGVSRLASRRKT